MDRVPVEHRARQLRGPVVSGIGGDHEQEVTFHKMTLYVLRIGEGYSAFDRERLEVCDRRLPEMNRVVEQLRDDLASVLGVARELDLNECHATLGRNERDVHCTDTRDLQLVVPQSPLFVLV